MKVLKFGGTSVGSSKNISKVIKIVKEESATENIVVVVSAVGGITDKLLAAADKAINKDYSYKQDFDALRLKHIDVIDGLLKHVQFFRQQQVIKWWPSNPLERIWLK